MRSEIGVFAALLALFIPAHSACPQYGVPKAPLLRDTVNAFTIGGVVPDLLPRFNPIALMRVLYDHRETPFSTVYFPGQRVSQQRTRRQPRIRVRLPPDEPLNSALRADSSYTFLIIDPDVPSRINVTLGPFRHMLATQVKLIPNHPYYDLNFTIDPISPYFPPAPPEATGFHRYTFLLFSGQPAVKATRNLQNSESARFNFSLTQFLAQAGLCEPIAGTFMFTENYKDEVKSLLH